MLDKNTIKKITKIQELLANKKEGTLVACHGAVDPQETVFNAIVINNEGAISEECVITNIGFWLCDMNSQIFYKFQF